MFLRQWSLRKLVLAWVAWWVMLLLVAAFPAIRDYVLLQMRDAHGTVSVEVTASMMEMALWILGPPLALTMAWIVARPRVDAAPAPSRELGAPAAEPGHGETRRGPEPVGRDDPRSRSSTR